MFCILNGYGLEVATDDAVDLMLAAAAGELTETGVAAWLADRLQPLESA
jgi:prophage maintenance system killer protein